MGKLFVVVETVVLCSETESLMPLHAHVFPIVEPFHFRARFAEKLHLHLLELTHSENELTGHYLVSEGFAYLCNAKGELHASCFLNAEVIYENSLSCFGAQVYG